MEDHDFLICFGATKKELYDMGYIVVGEKTLKTSEMANAINRAFKESYSCGSSEVLCLEDKYSIIAGITEHLPKNDRFDMIFKIVDINEKVLFSWREPNSVAW